MTFESPLKGPRRLSPENKATLEGCEFFFWHQTMANCRLDLKGWTFHSRGNQRGWRVHILFIYSFLKTWCLATLHSKVQTFLCVDTLSCSSLQIAIGVTTRLMQVPFKVVSFSFFFFYYYWNSLRKTRAIPLINHKTNHLFWRSHFTTRRLCQQVVE